MVCQAWCDKHNYGLSGMMLPAWCNSQYFVVGLYENKEYDLDEKWVPDNEPCMECSCSEAGTDCHDKSKECDLTCDVSVTFSWITDSCWYGGSCWQQVNWSSDRSSTWDMIHIKSSVISPGCPCLLILIAADYKVWFYGIQLQYFLCFLIV